MAKTINQLTVEELTQQLVQGTIDINLLDLRQANQRKAYLDAIKQRRALLARISSDRAPEFLGLAISENWEYFVQLNRAQYTNGLAQIYLWGRLTKSEKTKKGAKEFSFISLNKSLDDKIVFNYSYVSPDGDELFYFDKELDIPLAIKSSIKLTIKLQDAVALIEKLDTHVTQLGENKIKATINDLVASSYKAYLSKYITENDIGYYTLCTSLDTLENGFKEYINATLAEYGMVATEFYVKKIAIPESIRYQVEDLAFKLRQRRTEVEADAEFSKLSLEGYQAKLALMAKYPGGEFTLTEYEKDQALARYLEKMGRARTEEIDHSITVQQRIESQDSTVEKSADIIPAQEEKPNTFKKLFIGLCVAAAIIAIIIMAAAEEFVPGFVFLIVSAAILGIVGFLNKDKLTGAANVVTTETGTAVGGQSAFGGKNENE